VEALEKEKPSLQVPLTLFRILMDTAKCHYAFSSFFLLWSEQKPANPM